MRFVAACAGAFLSALFCFSAFAGKEDPFLWLEETESKRARGWVQTQNDLTLRSLRSDARYAETLADARTIVTARDRLPYGNLAGGWVHNFWQDDKHRRGVWRRARLAEYREADPHWQTLIDVDALAKKQGEDLSWKGAECLPPAFTRCLVQLSKGSNDAITVHEFDIATKSFVPGGFVVDYGKTDIGWVDANTVIIATSGGKGLTASGSLRVVKLWNRGEPLADAKTIFEAKASDSNVRPMVYFDRDGKAELFIVCARSKFDSDLFYVDPNSRVTRLAIPNTFEFKGFHRRQLLFVMTRDSQQGDVLAGQGALVGFSLDQYLSGDARPSAKLLFAPERKLSVASIAIGRDAIYLSVLDNVKGRIHEVTFDGHQWFWRRLTLPDNGSAEVVSVGQSDAAVLIKYANFVTPDRLYIATKGEDPRTIQSLPERFDAGDIEVTQHEAVSSDGARIPYFFVRREGTRNDGQTPALIYAYGGFQVSTTPWYWSSAGKLWLEEGGAYAVANVRGGGEFGQRWHEAATGERRQKNFDDLAAVARDMVARGFTSPRRLGVIGSTQGGLLATGAFVQNPDLFNAVSAQVPLTDMLRYTRLSAGGSNWISEYGNPDDPRQRAIISRWSPYQNVRSGVRYPRAFFMTSTRAALGVHPAHARKMAAKLGAMGQPTLYLETTQTADTSQERAEQLALTYTYFRQQLMD